MDIFLFPTLIDQFHHPLQGFVIASHQDFPSIIIRTIMSHLILVLHLNCYF